MPCWYELSLLGVNGESGLFLGIHSDYANHCKEVLPSAPIVKAFLNSLGFSEFSGVFGENFGFEGSLKYRGTVDDFLKYSIPTPLCRKPTGQLCGYCAGTRQDQFGDICPACEDGKEIHYDYQEAYAVSATLSVLFLLLDFPEIETTATFPQLLTVNTVAEREVNGGSISGSYSCELVSYLKSRPSGPIPEMVAAMRTVWQRFEGRIQESDENHLMAFTQGTGGWLTASCPSDRVGIYPCDHSAGNNRGYEFSSHNVDRPTQQLTLLASLAALHDLARASGC